MSRSWPIIAVVLASLGVPGCASSPWSAGNAASTAAATPVAANRATEVPSPSGTPGQGDAERLQSVMAELRQLGAIDPAAQDRLLEDLRRSDPAIWPLVIQQCRATLAYRRRAMEQQGGMAEGREKGDSPHLPGRPEGCFAQMGTVPFFTPPQREYPSTCTRAADEANPWWSRPPAPAAAGQPPAPQNGIAGQPPYRRTDATPAPQAGPQDVCGFRPASAAAPPSSQVMQASYAAPVAPAAGDWRGWLTAAIDAMEAQTPGNPRTPAEVAQQARLRMLYAAAGRREDAARPIPGAPPATQQFVSKELDGLGAWLDVERTPDAARRAAETKPVLAEALGKLAESAPLTVRHLAFCTEVLSFGCAKRFDKYEFAANQEVLLYAEVENFASEPTPKGYHTSLRSSYQILDARGGRVAEHTFAPTEEYCQNLRRDFFIGYHLRLPKQLTPGKYTLRLSIEDLMCRKTGQASVEFSVKDAGGAGK